MVEGRACPHPSRLCKALGEVQTGKAASFIRRLRRAATSQVLDEVFSLHVVPAPVMDQRPGHFGSVPSVSMMICSWCHQSQFVTNPCLPLFILTAMSVLTFVHSVSIWQRTSCRPVAPSPPSPGGGCLWRLDSTQWLGCVRPWGAAVTR